MGLRDSLSQAAAKIGEEASRAASSPQAERLKQHSRSLGPLVGIASEEPVTVDQFLIALVHRVRDDERHEGARRRDVYETARKRRRRLAALALSAGPLAKVANQFADLYCEAALVCDLCAQRGMTLSNTEIAAQVLALWGICESPAEARQALGGDPPLAELLGTKLSSRVSAGLPAEASPKAVTKALWGARSALDDVRGGKRKGSVRAVLFTGHRTKGLLKEAERQLDAEAAEDRGPAA